MDDAKNVPLLRHISFAQPTQPTTTRHRDRGNCKKKKRIRAKLILQPAALSLSLPCLVRLQARLSRGAGTPVRIVINRPGPSPRHVPPPRRLSTDLPPVEPERTSPWTPRNPESLRQQANFGPWWWSSWWEFLPNFAPAARTFRS